jgi:hypothetical protein
VAIPWVPRFTEDAGWSNSLYNHFPETSGTQGFLLLSSYSETLGLNHNSETDITCNSWENIKKKKKKERELNCTRKELDSSDKKGFWEEKVWLHKITKIPTLEKIENKVVFFTAFWDF